MAFTKAFFSSGPEEIAQYGELNNSKEFADFITTRNDSLKISPWFHQNVESYPVFQVII